MTPCPRCSFRLWPRALPPALRFHDLRSTFGTHAYEATGDVRFVQAVLGHSDPRLTEERYSALRNQRLLEQGRRLSFGTVPATGIASATYPALTGAPGRDLASRRSGTGRINDVAESSWWAKQGSNLRPSVCKTDALPLSYSPGPADSSAFFRGRSRDARRRVEGRRAGA